MMFQRQHIAEGRRDSPFYRAGIYTLLVAGAVPVLLPLYWLVLASLKTKDRVEAYPPDWLPVVPRTFIRVAGQDVTVKVLDTGQAAGTFVARAKLMPGDDSVLQLPAADIGAMEAEEWYAVVDGVRRGVVPRGAPHDGVLEVELPGLYVEETVSLSALRRTEEVAVWWQVLGVELPLHAPTEVPAEGSVVVRWDESADGVAVAPHVFDPTTNEVLWRGRRLAARLLTGDAGGGFVRVTLICPPNGVTVPVDELRRQVRVRWTALIDDQWHPVRLLHQDLVQNVARVEILDRRRTARVPADAVEHVRTTRYTAQLLGQTVAVEPMGDVSALHPQMSVPVRVGGVLSVASDRLRTIRALEPQWQNYALAWREQTFGRFVINTLFIAALVVLGSVLSCGLVGYAFARLEFRGRDALFLLLLATLMVPGQVTSIPTFVLFARLGWLDSYRPLIVPSFLASSAFFVFLYRQYMRTIPTDLEDAARIDGCGPLQAWWLVIMPLCRPIIVTVAVFAFVGVWNDFLGPLLYINSDEKQTVALGLQNFKSGFQYDDPQLLMAASVMMMLPCLLLFFIAQRAFLRGVVVSGLKG